MVDMVDGWVDREKVFAMLDDALSEPLVPNAETWGTGPRAERGMRAMMALVGGPGPPRP